MPYYRSASHRRAPPTATLVRAMAGMINMVCVWLCLRVLSSTCPSDCPTIFPGSIQFPRACAYSK